MIIDSKIKYGGRYHVRGGNIRALGNWKPERIIIIEFPSEENIHIWLKSPEYSSIVARHLDFYKNWIFTKIYYVF
jgi:uncharacterized protein (DUF1330 family)